MHPTSCLQVPFKGLWQHDLYHAILMSLFFINHALVTVTVTKLFLLCLLCFRTQIGLLPGSLLFYWIVFCVLSWLLLSKRVMWCFIQILTTYCSNFLENWNKYVFQKIPQYLPSLWILLTNLNSLSDLTFSKDFLLLT